MECEKSTCNWDNHTDIPDNYKPPVMINIPNEGQKVSVHVLSTKNSAYLDTSSMYALDFEGNTIKVDASKNTFSHCLCANSTEFVIAKSVPDKFGNYAETTFQVNIIGGSLIALVVIALIAFRVVKTYSINKKKEISSNQNVHIYGLVKD